MKKRQISNPKQQRIDFNHQDLEKMIVKKHKSKLAFFYLQAIQIQFGDYMVEMRNDGFHNFLSVLGLSDGEIDGKQRWGGEREITCLHARTDFSRNLHLLKSLACSHWFLNTSPLQNKENTREFRGIHQEDN